MRYVVTGAGYAYATTWKDRSAYRATVEVTVYVGQDVKGRGVGRHLYTALLDQLAADGIHAAIGVISLPNDDSVRDRQDYETS
jgi:L-amino acid N-acyltransferase YncA